MFRALALAAALVLSTSLAHAVTIDFEASPFGSQSEGFSAGGAPEVAFFSNNGDGLYVGDFGSQGDGNSLAVFSDADGNFLVARLAGSATSVSLTFGNDDSGFTNPGDLATLQVFSGTTLVGTSTVLLNRDDDMNQTISFSGPAFDSFTFAYTDAAGVPYTGGGEASTGLIEIVDNIEVNVGVPEPASLAVIGVGLLGVGVVRRKRG